MSLANSASRDTPLRRVHHIQTLQSRKSYGDKPKLRPENIERVSNPRASGKALEYSDQHG